MPEYKFEKDGCEDPRIVKYEDTYYLFYVGHENNIPGNIYLATSKDFIHWEKYGQVPNVIFAEGMVKYKSKWYLYYGCADTYIGVAISKDSYEFFKK